MKTVNPLHIIAFLFVLLAFFIMKLSWANTELREVKKTYEKTLLLTTKLKSLQEIYSNKEDVKKSILRILKQSTYKSANIVHSVGKSSIKISSNSMKKIALNALMSKVLNGSYNIRFLKIKRLGKLNASFSMEIKW